MKVECIKEKIRNAVSLAEKITGKNLTLPVLSTILLIVKDKVIKIRSTNLDLGIEIEIPAKVEKEGVIAIQGVILNSFLSNIYDTTVILESINNNLSVITNNSSTLIKSTPHDDFPTLPNISQGQSFTLPAQKLITGLKSVWYSAGTSDIKPEISSINIYTDSGNIIFVATDSFRLAEKKISFSRKEEISSILIPFKNISEVIRAFNDLSGDIIVRFNSNQISFQHDGIYLTSRLIDGTFPDYRQILPKGFKTEVIVLKQDLINSLKTTHLFADKFNQINIKINPRDKFFRFCSKNFDIGENVVKVDAALSGDPVDLNFNYKYIFDCFQSITKDSVSLQLNGESRPLIMQGVGDRTFTYLIMPLNQ